MINRSSIISELSKFFKVKELVCDHIYNKYGENSWQFLDTQYLNALLILRRDVLKSPMVCNYVGHFQRGMRCNQCQYVKSQSGVYVSAHILGKAGDFTIAGMTAQQARDLIRKNISKFQCPIRVEKDVNWLHFDVRDTNSSMLKYIEFTA